MEEKKSTYKEMLEYVKQMEESADMYKSLVENTLDGYGFSLGAINKLAESVTKDDINKQPDEALEKILTEVLKNDQDIFEVCKNFHQIKDEPKNFDKDMIPVEETKEELAARMEKFDKNWEDSKYTYMKRVLNSALDDIAEIKRSYDEVKSLKNDANKALDDYIDYISSDEYRKKKMEKIEELRKKAEESDDPKEKKGVLEACAAIEASLNLSFISKRINANQKEIMNLVDTFFSNQRSRYVMEKFESKAKRFGYKPDVYSYLFNIEEKFLDEKYHVYNNLFLFEVLRFVGNADPYNKNDKLFVSSIITNMTNLVYQRFASAEVRAGFLKVICNFLDNFEPYREKFEKDNILSPTHPTRIAKKEEHANQVREMCYVNLKDMGYEITDEVKAFDMDALRKLYDEVLDDYKKKGSEKSDIDDLIYEIHLNSESYTRSQLKRKYMQVSEFTDEDNEEFNTKPIEYLEAKIAKARKELEEASSKDSAEGEPDSAGETDTSENSAEESADTEQ